MDPQTEQHHRHLGGVGTGLPVPAPSRLATWGLACALAGLLPVLDLLLSVLGLPEPPLIGGILVLASPVLALVGVVLSALALRDGSGRRGRAITGLVVGSVWLALVLAYVLLLVVSL